MGGANDVRAGEAGTFATNLLFSILMRVLMQAVSHRIRLPGDRNCDVKNNISQFDWQMRSLQYDIV